MFRKIGSLEALGALCLLTRLDRSSPFAFLFTPGVVRDAVRASNVLSYHHDIAIYTTMTTNPILMTVTTFTFIFVTTFNLPGKSNEQEKRKKDK